jgi:hypothetical protein
MGDLACRIVLKISRIGHSDLESMVRDPNCRFEQAQTLILRGAIEFVMAVCRYSVELLVPYSPEEGVVRTADSPDDMSKSFQNGTQWRTLGL